MNLEGCRARLGLPEVFRRLNVPCVGRGGNAAEIREGGTHILSPFRAEKTPSFWVRLSKGKWGWHDFGSGEGGDDVDFIERWKGLTRAEAIRALHDLAGVPMGDGTAPPRARKVWKRKAEAAKDAEPEVGELPEGLRGQTAEAVYSYTDESGERTLHETVRFPGKFFTQRRPLRTGESAGEIFGIGELAKAEEEGKKVPRVEDGWVWTLAGAERIVPFRLDRVAAAGADTPVFICEGEKDALNVEALGLVATTLPMGAGKWRGEFDQYFRGKWAVVVEDYDAAKPVKVGGVLAGLRRTGREGGLEVARCLVSAGAARLGYATVEGLAGEHAREGWDVSDVLNCWAGLGVAEEAMREALLDAAERCDAAVDDGVFFGNCVEEGAVVQDRLADAVVLRHRLIFAEGDWWKYGGGVWEKLRTRRWLDARVRDAVRPLARGKIESRFLSSVGAVMASSRCLHPNDFNPSTEAEEGRFLLNCRNGMVDAGTGEIVRHAERFLSTSQVGVTYDPAAGCPNWEGWLAERLPEEAAREQAREWFGYCLVPGLNFHTFAFLFGDGGTGKSTFAEAMMALIGEGNTLALRPRDLANPFTRNQLVGKQLYLCSEAEAGSFKEMDVIKAIASGDPIYVDVKNREGFSYRPKGKLMIISNLKAYTPDASEGFGRRFLQITWERVIEVKDFGFFEKVLTPELPGILNWALTGFRNLLARGGFAESAGSAEALRDVQMHRNQVGTFLKDRVRVHEGKNGHVTNADLYRAYLDWCQDMAVVAHFSGESKSEDAFVREVLSKRPDLRERKKRAESVDGFGDRVREQRWYGVEILDGEGEV